MGCRTNFRFLQPLQEHNAITRAYLIFKPTFKLLPDETLSILVLKTIILNIKSFKGAVGWKHKCLLLYKFWVIDYNTTISTENLTFVWLVCILMKQGEFSAASPSGMINGEARNIDVVSSSRTLQMIKWQLKFMIYDILTLLCFVFSYHRVFLFTDYSD